MKRLLLTVLVLLVAILLMSPSLSQGQPKYGGTLTVASNADISQVDPHKAVTAQDGIALSLICEDLVTPGKNFEPLPGLAESWDVSPDGMVWTFHLRKGVKFHNGRDFTAEEVKWNIDRILDPKTGSTWKSKLDNVASFEVVDPYTVKFVLKEPSGSFLAQLSGSVGLLMFIAPECVNEDGSVTHPIGTGPFEFVEWKPNDYFKVKAFKDYWDKGLPYLEEVILKPVPDDIIRLTALKAGDLDMAYFLPLEEMTKMMKAPPKDLEISLFPSGGTNFINFNCSQPPFDNVLVRRAVLYAINREDIMMGITQGYGTVINQPFWSGSYWYCEVPEIKQDLAKAKALLAEAGHPNGLETTLTVTNTYQFHLMSAQIVQAQLAQIGLKVTLDVSDWSNYINQMVKSDFKISICGWSAYSDPNVWWPQLLIPGGVYHWFFGPGEGYNNPELNEILKQAGAGVDQAKRKELYTRAVEIYNNEDAAWIHMYVLPCPFAWKTYVKGFEPQVGALLHYAGQGLHKTWLDK